MVSRGCGDSRTEGGIYFVTKLSKKGRPLRDFLLDPPIPVPANFDLPARGVVIRERMDGSGIHDVWDHVGSNHYPNVFDFIFETANLGLSRHVSGKIDFSKITSESLIIMAHERAVLTNHRFLYQLLWEEKDAYKDSGMDGYQHALMGSFSCPKDIFEHVDLVRAAEEGRLTSESPCCLGHGIELVTGGDDAFDPDERPRTVTRVVGDTTYKGRKAPDGFKPEYQRGFFMALPLSGIEVVKGGENDDLAIERASQSGLNVDLVDE